MTKNCQRCDKSLEKPVDQHASYVLAEDMVVTESVEVVEALVHTDATKRAIEQLHDEYCPHVPMDTLEQVVASDTDLVNYLGSEDHEFEGEAVTPTTTERVEEIVPGLYEFERLEITDVADAPPGTVKVEKTFVDKPVQKTGLVCSGCLHDGDVVIWHGNQVANQ